MGVCFIAGYAVLGDPAGKDGPDKVDLDKIVSDWIKANPKSTLLDSDVSISEKLLDSMKRYLRAHPKFHPKTFARPDDPFSSFVCVGYYMALQQIYQSSYTVTAGDVTAKMSAGSPATYHYQRHDCGHFGTAGCRVGCLCTAPLR
jgi:hypothetical protein